MKNIAIIPARSGSKGLKDKNIRNLNGRPLLAWTIDAAVRSGEFDEIMVSTDSEAYAEIARQCGADVPFLRSPGPLPKSRKTSPARPSARFESASDQKTYGLFCSTCI